MGEFIIRDLQISTNIFVRGLAFTSENLQDFFKLHSRLFEHFLPVTCVLSYVNNGIGPFLPAAVPENLHPMISSILIV